MNKNDVWDDEINPDGISKPLHGLFEEVWDRGYCCDTVDGTWYEVYVTENLKDIYQKINLDDPDDFDRFGRFHDLNLSCFEEFGQITFFVPNDEDEFTLDYLTEIFA